MSATATACHATIPSPVGELVALGDGERLRGLYMREGRKAVAPAIGSRRAEEPFAELREQLGEYFAGERTRFDLPLAPAGSAFEREVWAALEDIPYGATVTYGELAERIGGAAGPRAVGWANGRNPLSIVVPCHRVIGADGSLTGFAGGLERKRFLLVLEGALLV